MDFLLDLAYGMFGVATSLVQGLFAFIGMIFPF